MPGSIFTNIESAVHQVTPTPVTFDEMQNFNWDENYDKLFSKGDADLYSDGQCLVNGTVSGTFQCRNMEKNDEMIRGDEGDLVAKTSGKVSGQDVEVTLANVMFSQFPGAFNHAEHDDQVFAFDAVSNDGLLNPVSFVIG